MRRIVMLGLIILAWSPTQSAAQDLQSEHGLIWDVSTTEGVIWNGSGDAYDGAFYLEVNSVQYSTYMNASEELEGRGYLLHPVNSGDLFMSRHIFVSKTAGDFARFLDVIENPTEADIAASIAITGNLGSDGGTVMMGSSNGDTVLDLTDLWFATDDEDGSGDPSLTHIFQGPDRDVSISSISLDRDNFRWQFDTTIPAGQRIAILTFAVQSGNQERAQHEAQTLVELPEEVLLGLDEYMDIIINW